MALYWNKDEMMLQRLSELHPIDLTKFTLVQDNTIDRLSEIPDVPAKYIKLDGTGFPIEMLEAEKPAGDAAHLIKVKEKKKKVTREEANRRISSTDKHNNGGVFLNLNKYDQRDKHAIALSFLINIILNAKANLNLLDNLTADEIQTLQDLHDNFDLVKDINERMNEINEVEIEDVENETDLDNIDIQNNDSWI